MKNKVKNNAESRDDAILFFIVFGVVIFIYFMIENKDLAVEGKPNRLERLQVSKEFRDGEMYICPVSNSRYIEQERYLVSKKTGWVIFNKIYFKKDDLLLDIDMCSKSNVDRR